MSDLGLTLYVDAHFSSPYAMSVFVALKEKQLPFELKTVDLHAGDNRADDYAHTSLTQRVPTLVHGNFALSESSAITEYLDETFEGVALYPRDPQKRARARQVQAWLRSDLMPIREERPTSTLFYAPSQTPLSEKAMAAAKKLAFAAEGWLQDRQYLCGEWSLADVDLALMLNRLALNGDPIPKVLAYYAQQQWQRPSVQEWIKMQRPALA
ncbi:glutathione S-transferase [Chitinivorax tropicus]|uniref:Glutathione S-transferase n=1 Tax=Chitinivorax tropicus TaxID=714531 RepID=A0A840MFU3_9PROT|nr:glutathione transferase [Chitinivorax tropicus]MBB5017270.1 glutathione S-transferase [Chitinivorax tropicus]